MDLDLKKLLEIADRADRSHCADPRCHGGMISYGEGTAVGSRRCEECPKIGAAAGDALCKLSGLGIRSPLARGLLALAVKQAEIINGMLEIARANCDYGKLEDGEVECLGEASDLLRDIHWKEEGDHG